MKMKKFIYITIILSVLLSLQGCFSLMVAGSGKVGWEMYLSHQEEKELRKLQTELMEKQSFALMLQFKRERGEKITAEEKATMDRYIEDVSQAQSKIAALKATAEKRGEKAEKQAGTENALEAAAQKKDYDNDKSLWQKAKKFGRDATKKMGFGNSEEEVPAAIE